MSAPFAQITQGPANTTGKNTNQQALVFDRQNNIVTSVGDTGTEAVQQTALAVLNAQTALTTITTAQNLFNQALGKGVLNRTKRALQIYGSGVYTSPGTTAPTLSFAVMLGAVTLCTITTAALSTTASTDMPFNFCFTLSTVSTGASGTVESHGMVNINLSANTPAAAVSSFNDTNTAVSAAVDLTTALALKVTLAASLTVTSATLRQFTVEVIA